MKRRVASVLSFFVVCLLFYLALDSFVLRQTYTGSTMTCDSLRDNTVKSNSTWIRKDSPTFLKLKTDGVVYDCLSKRPMRHYDAAVIEKTSKPIQMTNMAGEDPAARKSSFVEIFNQQIWGGRENGVRDQMSEEFKASGPGSDLRRTMGCMALLHTIIEKLKRHLKKEIISIADVPCGDLQWMSHFLQTRSDVKYTGIDIVPTLIERHKNTYRSNPNVNFINSDVVHTPMNQSFDIIFSRQMMQHFKNSDVIRVLNHFSQSGSKYMIATTYTNFPKNSDLGSTNSVRFRTVNLEKPPFNLVPPVCSYQEPEDKANYLGFWELPLRVTE